MMRIDNIFFEKYKQLSRICSDMYSTSGDFSQCVLNMEEMKENQP